jgi:spore coat protein U-like protein
VTGAWRGLLIVGALWLLTPSAASAQNCSISAVTGVAFGNYNVYAAAALDSAGSVSVRCLLALTVQVQLNSGMHGTFAARAMDSGAGLLTYNLYTTAARTVVWGDGSQSTSFITLVLSLLNLSQNVPIYGRIGAQQNVAVGSYTDTVTITIIF